MEGDGRGVVVVESSGSELMWLAARGWGWLGWGQGHAPNARPQRVHMPKPIGLATSLPPYRRVNHLQKSLSTFNWPTQSPDMANNSSTPDLDNLHLDDTDPDDLFASPGQPRDKKLDQNAALNADSKPRAPKTNYDDADNREAKLRQELENVRRVNKVIEDAVASLEKAKDNMDVSQRFHYILSIADMHRLSPGQ